MRLVKTETCSAGAIRTRTNSVDTLFESGYGHVNHPVFHVLQYRYLRIHNSIEGSGTEHAQTFSSIAWSEWFDVPVILIDELA